MISHSVVQNIVRFILDRSADGAALIIGELVELLGPMVVREYVDAFEAARKDADAIADEKFGPNGR